MAELDVVGRQSTELEELLDTRRGQIKLREIIEQAGLDTAHNAFELQAKELDEKGGRLVREATELEGQLKSLFNEEKAKEIRSYLNARYHQFATELEVPRSLQNRTGESKIKPRQGGSGGPRAVLAYYFALAHTAVKYGSGSLPPLVLDSPNQKAQDEINRPMVTEFIFRHAPETMQLIAGLEDPPPQTVVFGNNDIRFDLTKKFNLLEKQYYKEVRAFIAPLAEAASQRLMESP